jgi:hypothetical protein
MPGITSSGSVSGAHGQVLGASTPAVLGAVAPAILGASGAAILPVTGNNPWVMLFVIISMTVATMVLLSFVVSRIIRKFI